MNHPWPTGTTLAICFVSGADQLDWGGQDHAGRFHAEYLWANGNLGTSLGVTSNIASTSGPIMKASVLPSVQAVIFHDGQSSTVGTQPAPRRHVGIDLV